MNPGQKIVLKGIAASPGGKISGRVRIVSSPQELEKLEEGYILVSSFLTPVFMSSIKKIPRVSGIVTDKGGGNLPRGHFRPRTENTLCCRND